MTNKEFLETVLPHKKPMILIDDIVNYSPEDKSITSVVTISEDSLFYDKEINGISSLVGIEYMAQTIGCYAFYRKKQGEPQIGFLLGTRVYNNLLEKFKLNQTYTITAREVFYDNDITSFACCIYDDKKEEIASATINAYQSDNIKDMTNG